MSSGRRIPFAAAYGVAEEVAQRLAPHVRRHKCVGSVRRRLETVGDIEFVAEPVMHGDLFGAEAPLLEPIRAALRELGTWVKGGERMMQVTDVLGWAGLTLDLYLVHPPAAWGSAVAIRTGPADLGRYCVSVMRDVSGVRHEEGYAQDMVSGLAVPTETEKDFFKLAGVECVPPSQRDELARRLWDDYNRAHAGPRANQR